MSRARASGAVGALGLRAAALALAAAAMTLPALGPGPGNGRAEAAPRPKQETIPRVTLGRPTLTAVPASDSMPNTYEGLVRRFATLTPSDSMGNGDYQSAEALFAAGQLDEAAKAFHEFARRYPRNLNVNDALATMLLIREARDFEDIPLHLYARARAHRTAGRADSARALLQEAVERYPGAKARHRIHYALSEMAWEREDYRSALRWALAAADTTATNRVAPFALKIAAESSLALGEPPQKALGYYKVILERYPTAAVTPEARARALEIRKRMPQ